MKNAFCLLAILTVSLWATSCEKDDDDNNTGSTQTCSQTDWIGTFIGFCNPDSVEVIIRSGSFGFALDIDISLIDTSGTGTETIGGGFSVNDCSGTFNSLFSGKFTATLSDTKNSMMLVASDGEESFDACNNEVTVTRK